MDGDIALGEPWTVTFYHDQTENALQKYNSNASLPCFGNELLDARSLADISLVEVKKDSGPETLTTVRDVSYIFMQEYAFFRDMASPEIIFLQRLYPDMWDLIVLKTIIAHFLSSTVIIFLFQYLIGYIERGVWATYSDTSWEFRATYVSIELRLAAYFWFKFRALPTQPSSSERGRKRSRAELKGTPSISKPNARNKIEPKLKAQEQTGDKGMVSIWLGEYHTPQEAAEVYWIGAYYYNRFDRMNDDVLSWCRENLPPITPNLAVDEKRKEVRRHAKDYLRRRYVGFDVEPHQGAGYVDLVVTPGTVEGDVLSPNDVLLQSPPSPPCGGTQCVLDGGDLFPIENLLQSSLPPLGDIELTLEEFMGGVLQQPDSTRIDMTQRDLEDVSADDYFPGSNSTLDGASGHGLGNEGQNSLRTCRDLSIYKQQDVQHLQQNHEGAIDLEGGDAPEAEAILQQDETEVHPVLRAPPANHTQAVPSPTDAPELKTLKITDTILSMSQELHEQGWGFRTRFRHSNSCSVAFSRCEGREGPLLTGPITSTFKEIHGQGFDIILEPTIGNASAQDGKAQSRAGSRDLCGNCQARLCRNCTVAE